MDPINNQNSSGMMNGMPPVPKQEKKLGPIVGVIIVILILIVAALFFLGKDLNTGAPAQEAPIEQSVDSTPNTSAAADAASELSDIQAELDAEFQDVDYSF